MDQNVSDYLTKPLRTLERYRNELWTELANSPEARPGSARAVELVKKIRAAETEIESRRKRDPQ